MFNIELHIFTNSTISSPSTTMIEQTFQSFEEIFSVDTQPTIWCDPNPNIEKSQEYITYLKKIFSKVNKTDSLSDGYIQAVKKSNADFLFMLEHDWKFLDTITHSLNSIIEVMHEEQIVHLRFNKRFNIAKKFDKDLKEINHKKMPYCLTNGVSNNPHIINRSRYVNNALQYITLKEKSFGIESELSNRGIKAAIYGSENYPATILHKDGKHSL
jgi:hypothetical protein